MTSLLKENIRISLQAIRSQLLRTILTILIIALGLMALIGILTAIDAIKSSINSNFTTMGANTFTIRNRETTVRIGRKGKRPKKYKPISYTEAQRFKKQFQFPSLVSISTMGSMGATAKYKSNKTNPNMQLFGVDENYLSTSGYELQSGRNITTRDIENNVQVALIGKEIATTLFTSKENPLEQTISIRGGKYRVIGILKPRGTSMGFGGDKIGVLPLENVRQHFSMPNMSFKISVLSKNQQALDIAVSEATGLLRQIRDVGPGEENNFEIAKSDNLANLLIKNIQNVTIGATAIGLITLLGAAIGLMNIMLVSVSERTREIGIRKAIGATQKIIKNQFLIESVVICQLGGLTGIFLGILAGNAISLVLGVGFIMPWIWIITGILLCLAVGIISGIYPAIKASRLDPIEALRVE